MKLVVFDFDGTLTKKDSFLEFIRFSRGSFKFYAGFILLMPVLVLYKLHLLKNWKAKEWVLTFYFRNLPFDRFMNLCHGFALQKINTLLRPAAKELLMDRLKENALIVIVTASPEYWIKPWADKYNIEVIGTRLQVTNNRITGKIDGKNCYGPEKLIRLKNKINIQNFSEIEVYGDSQGDREIMGIATAAYFKHF